MEAIKRILIIDDEADITILLKHVLAEASFDVEVALGGQQGLAQASATHFDIVLIDMKMPDLHGIQVLRQLREQESTRNLPVIILTGSAPDVGLVVASIPRISSPRSSPPRNSLPESTGRTGNNNCSVLTVFPNFSLLVEFLLRILCPRPETLQTQ